ncbi:MAG TPA: shikimate kinase [Halobacteriales archaeon]|jgi:shikimate kinase|nr:shikimate kinase [Halobacteriales archaeon]
MKGCARAPGAGTILNALANGYGSAFAIDIYTTAEVVLQDVEKVTGEIEGAPNADTALIEKCVEIVVDRFGNGEGGSVLTRSEIPIASGLKSSSAAANATVLASLSALSVGVGENEEITMLDAALIGVQAAREVGVTITGAFDDSSASMVGGLTLTNNNKDELLKHEESIEWDVLVWTPEQKAYSAEADVDRCSFVSGVADIIVEMVKDGRYLEAMTVNGLAFCAALEYSVDPILEALPTVDGVSLSGTGPSMTAVGSKEVLKELENVWEIRGGNVIHTKTQMGGASII